jgi:hypothetical protein
MNTYRLGPVETEGYFRFQIVDFRLAWAENRCSLQKSGKERIIVLRIPVTAGVERSHHGFLDYPSGQGRK